MPSIFNQINSNVVIKVIGVGGGGNNAVDRMISDELGGVEYINVNTDYKSLTASKASVKINIGDKITKNQGTGMNPEIGRRCAEESIEAIKDALKGANMVFITAGMGGGTGTGAAPVIAEAARKAGILTIAIVTKPFNFEGANKMRQAEAGIALLANQVDSLIIIPNDRLKLLTDKKITLFNAFMEADEILRKGVQSISELITANGYINLDFADISAIMRNAGLAHMGVGVAKGKDKAEQAAKMAMSSPLLETNISGSKGIIVNITSSPDITLEEIEQASTMITDEASPDANIIFGNVFDTSMEDMMKITLIATGFENTKGAFKKPLPTTQPADKQTDTIDNDIQAIIDAINSNRRNDM